MTGPLQAERRPLRPLRDVNNFCRDSSSLASSSNRAPAKQECRGRGTGFQARSGQLD
jgi:hypothetical protein